MRPDIVRRLGSVCLLITASCAPAFCSQTWYVNAAAQAPFDGSSFAHGFQKVQQAIDAAQDGDRIDVAQGTYVENLTIAPRAVELYGGYEGTNTTTSDPVAYPTILDGGGQGPVIVVTYATQTSREVDLDGFIIQNGTGMAYGGYTMGGGIVWASSGFIRRCVFRNNQLSSRPAYGGAIGVFGGTGFNSLNIDNCTFTNNAADSGGAIAVLSKPFAFSIISSTLDGNHGGAWGGAVYSEEIFYQSQILKNTFSNNTAMFGGAIALSNSNNQTIAGNTFTTNTAHPYGNGGALYISHSDPVVVTQNLFKTNTAESYGGAIYADTPGATSVAINSNMFTGNVANAFAFTGINGSGLVTNGAFVVNNTITGSTGDGISIAGPSYIANNIVAFNGAGIVKDSSVLAGPLHNNDVFGNTGAAYFNITDPTGTSGNIRQDPLFVNSAAGDFHLQTGSPCIDTGNTPDAVAYAGTRDFEDERRVYGPNVDIGADEYIPLLVFTTQPGNGRPNQPLNPQPVVTVEDRAGMPVPGFTGPVTLGIAPFTGSNGAALSGTKTVVTNNGVAAFTDLSIDKVSSYYVLTASAPTLDSVNSAPFGVLLLRSYVKPSGNNALDGSSWENAKSSIPAAFSVTGGPDAEVWVAAGTYYGPLVVPDGIMLYGGFSGTETSLSERNARARNTVIDGNNGNAAVRFIDSSGNGIDGFRITGGIGFAVADGLKSFHREGGGIYVAASPRIANNLIAGNNATFGGGIAVNGGRPVIHGNTIALNSVTAAANLLGAGGGLALLKGTAVLSDNLIYDNTATGENTAHMASVGGAMVVVGTHDIHNNTFVDNQSPLLQGDIYITSGSPAFVNNIIKNHAAIELAGGTPEFRHNDYVHGVTVNNPLPNIIGTNGNISVTPAFVNPTSGNFHLPEDSPLIDLGDIAAVKSRETDVDGQPRLMGVTVDIGADEVSVPYRFADAASALAMAGGLLEASPADVLRLDWEAPDGVDTLDAIRVVRKAAGLDVNP